MIRGEFFLFYIFTLFFFFLIKSRNFKSCLVSIIITLIVISPYLYRNFEVFNSVTITKSFGYNLLKGNNPTFTIEGNPKFIEKYNVKNYKIKTENNFEIIVTDFPGGPSNKGDESSNSVMNCARQLIPIYVVITISLWFLLTVSGVPAFKAILMSMYVISTSGFEVTSYDANNIFIVEGIILLFFAFALSKSLFIRDINEIQKFRLFKDPEIRLASIIILAVTGLFFANSFINYS